MAQITYTDKTALNINGDIADTNKVNASDMNEIKSVVNENYTELRNDIDNKNMITAVGSDQSITTNTDSKYTNIVFNSILSSVGNNITLNTTTGAITIGNGINYIKITCSCYINMGSTGTYHYLTIRKNGSQVGPNSQTKGQFSPSVYGITNLSNILIPVSQGDIITAQIFCRVAGSFTIGQPYISIESL